MAAKKNSSVFKQILVPVVIALLIGGSAPWWWGVLFGEKGPSPPPVVATDGLFEIESQLTGDLKDGPARFSDLSAYFKDANKELMGHLTSVAQVYASGQDHRGATYVAGPAGVGKSYLIGQLDMLPANATSRPIELSEWFKQPGPGFTTESAPDLRTTDGRMVFNTLRHLSQPETFDFGRFLADAGALHDDRLMSFVLIDDLDEIHPKSAEVILRELETYLRGPGDGFVHFIVFGRPEGFWPWLKHSDRKPLANVTNTPFLLQGPVYETTGDIELRCAEYYQWAHEGDAPQGVIDDFRTQVQKYPFLRHTVRSLATGNFVLEESIRRHRSGSSAHREAKALRDGLLSDMLSRNKESHNRPSINDDLYMLILERVAVFPIEQGRSIDERGFFDVLTGDCVEFTDAQGTRCRVHLRDVLNRSGVALLDPAGLRRTPYRFEPFWLHAHLVERWNQRNHPDHRYRWHQ